MSLNILFTFIFVLSSHIIKPETEVTLPIDQRIKLLRFKIAQELKRTRPTFEDKTTTLVNENLDYVNIEAITPISRGDARIKDQKYLLPELRTKTRRTTTIRPWDNEPDEKIYDDINHKIIVLKKNHKGRVPETIKNINVKNKQSNSEEFSAESVTVITKKKKPKKIKKDDKRSDGNKKTENILEGNDTRSEKNAQKGENYKNNEMEEESKQTEANENRSKENERGDEVTEEKQSRSKDLRRLISEDMMNSQIQGVHCQRVITPYFVGMKKDFEPPRHTTLADRSVKRFLELMSTNVTSFSKDDTYALLYQISETQIRLFQWEISAIRLLFNVIAGDGKRHTFKTLKYGIREKFKSWHLDFHWNTTVLLKDTLIFRPYCIDNKFGGSTLSSRVSRFIKSTTIPKDKDEDCD